MGKIIFLIAFFISLFILSDVLRMNILIIIGVAILIGLVIFSVIYPNTGDRFEIYKQL